MFNVKQASKYTIKRVVFRMPDMHYETINEWIEASVSFQKSRLCLLTKLVFTLN